MEAFSLLKYWRGGGGGATNANLRTTTTIANTVRQMVVETDEDDDDGDDGPFFDLEFTVPDNGDGENDNKDDDDSDSGEDNGDSESAGTYEEHEFDFRVSSSSTGGGSDRNFTSSPSDDLFFKGSFVPLEPSSVVFNSTEPNSKPQLPISFLKSATKFRVFLLGFKKPKSTDTEKVEINGASSPGPKQPQMQAQQQQSKSSTVKFKVEEDPNVSLFSRDNSSRSAGIKSNKQSSEEVASEEKKFAKDMLQKYLKMIKPLYVRGSKRYGEKLGFSGQLSLGIGKGGSTLIKTSSPTHNEAESVGTDANANNVKSQKQGTLPAGLRVVCKHLGKSRSASSTVAAAPPVALQSRRQDDSLLQQQDGIQSAILHCKRSFNASRDSDSSAFVRTTNDLSQEKPKTSFEECLREEKRD